MRVRSQDGVKQTLAAEHKTNRRPSYKLNKTVRTQRPPNLPCGRTLRRFRHCKIGTITLHNTSAYTCRSPSKYSITHRQCLFFIKSGADHARRRRGFSASSFQKYSDSLEECDIQDANPVMASCTSVVHIRRAFLGVRLFGYGA